MRKLILILALIISPSSLSLARKHKVDPDPVLCAIKTVYVKGNSEGATLIRKELNRGFLWLKLSNSSERADTIMDVAESDTPDTTLAGAISHQISVELTKGDETLWSGSAGSISPGAATGKVLLQLKKQAACD
jgi:hypothetical protein